ncbi:7-carboxy-7-deazaguanine synthase (Cx14CxxC type) [Ilumatobacter fluminis]|uniref:7-carboxy-7-deazaguanine synthase n=1 Tax=Ilumatobacter fluminis TaxID=467091 RepID=A0A4R7HUX2_9ACTN|nr:7-carboxy-7-deazaguanine synthase [Ilumatobacter fluminis]TDT14585.1 7-carboxy-7-deazaguanine synthase (Cx14CxxC type) [Ilumatobacter fluminis]
MSYRVKEIFYTLQGEGARAGRAAVFCRFAGCNLWSGQERHRPTAICQFCDTDFVGTDGPGGGKFSTADELAAAVETAWAGNSTDRRYVVCTGGEPLLQLDEQACAALRERGFEIAIETNGTIEVPSGVDWICVSPKDGAALVVHSGDELKLVFPQAGLQPAEVSELDFEHFYLQPMDGEHRAEATEQAVAYCLEHPSWQLSLQTHKLIGIP